MNKKNPYLLYTPEDISISLAGKIRQLRLARKWKQSTLADRAGVSLASLRRFERSGKGSINLLLRLSFTLDRLGDFQDILLNDIPATMAELENISIKKNTKRGSQ